MTTRTITARAKVYNNKTAPATYRINLVREVRDESDALVAGAGVVRSADTGEVAPGARSAEQTLTYALDVPTGYVVNAWCTLDRLSPSPATGISTSAAQSFREPSYGGVLEGVVITIAEHVGGRSVGGRLMQALVEAGTR